jgi:virginiamycin B lyase
MTLSGELAAVYPLPAPESRPLRLAAGPDGAVWFTQQWGNRIGRITVDGRLTEYPLPAAPTVRKPGDPAGTLATSIPVGITAGPDGAVWFTQGSTNRIGRITPAGQITEYPVPTAVSVPSGGYGPLTTSNPVALVTGADGALWFTQLDCNRIGRLELRPRPPSPGGLGLPRTGSAGAASP